MRNPDVWYLSESDLDEQLSAIDPDDYGHISAQDFAERLKGVIATRASKNAFFGKVDVYAICHQLVGKQTSIELSRRIESALYSAVAHYLNPSERKEEE